MTDCDSEDIGSVDMQIGIELAREQKDAAAVGLGTSGRRQVSSIWGIKVACHKQHAD
jgi:hypothetical protein